MSITLEEINQDIQDRDYILATPQNKIIPSFYKLEDDTILSVVYKINHVLKIALFNE